MAQLPEGFRPELPASERDVQRRAAPQLQRAAVARPRKHRDAQPAVAVQRAVPLQPRVLPALGPDEEPAHELPVGHPCRGGGTLYAGQQRPLSRPLFRLEGLRVAQHQEPRRALGLQAVVHGLLPAALGQAAHLRLAEERCLLQRQLLVAAGHRAGRRHLAGQYHPQRPQPERQRRPELRGALQPHPLPEEDQRALQETACQAAAQETRHTEKDERQKGRQGQQEGRRAGSQGAAQEQEHLSA